MCWGGGKRRRKRRIVKTKFARYSKLGKKLQRALRSTETGRADDVDVPGVTQEHNGSRAAVPALADVGTLSFLADRVQVEVAQRILHLRVPRVGCFQQWREKKAGRKRREFLRERRFHSSEVYATTKCRYYCDESAPKTRISPCDGAGTLNHEGRPWGISAPTLGRLRPSASALPSSLGVTEALPLSFAPSRKRSGMGRPPPPVEPSPRVTTYGNSPCVEVSSICCDETASAGLLRCLALGTVLGDSKEEIGGCCGTSAETDTKTQPNDKVAAVLRTNINDRGELIIILSPFKIIFEIRNCRSL